MKPELCIIIPCYNCVDTLEAAVKTCFEQSLANFEVIMVDDASTDGTKAAMEKMAAAHPEIKLFFHEKNRGGGAARNTAVAHALADIIFCLDSDDMLPPKTLSKMLAYIQEKKCDAVGFHHCLKFMGDTPEKIYRTELFAHAGERIPLENLIDFSAGNCSLYNTFMYAKAAFTTAGGYPETHGYDSQAFAWRFLGNSLSAYVCPDADYIQRTHAGRSYFIREYEEGRSNANFLAIYEEFLFLFEKDVRLFILNYDIFDSIRILQDDVQKFPHVFVHNPSARLDASDETIVYWQACELYRKGNYVEALSVLTKLQSQGYAWRQLARKVAMCEAALAGKPFAEVFPKRGSLAPFYVRALRKVRNYFL